MKIRRRVRVTGRVQGVGFRDTVRHLATGMGLAGFVRNEPDGSVVAELEGEAEVVHSLLDSLRQNPPRFARLEAVDAQPLSPTGETGFRITG